MGRCRVGKVVVVGGSGVSLAVQSRQRPCSHIAAFCDP